ncbi:MAG: ATP synthase F1 subunit epsilon [Ignavibacteriae bacterium]|nr:ATP synthase F1 subunit epsilon [Ignavibacteriota bacterium]
MASDKLLELEIVSPVKSVYEGLVKYVTAPGVMGEFQVLYNHAAMVAALQVGIMKIEDERGNRTEFSTSGGILEVKSNKISVLADTIESKEEIDIERAKKSLERGEKRLAENAENLDRARAEASIARAKNRLRLGQ